MKFKLSYIHQLIAEGEHQQLDFKFEISDSKKIARTLVAFANTDGGRLLVGVKDNGSITGVRTDEEVYMVDAAAEMYCKPPVTYEIERWQVEGKTVLEVFVDKSKKAPHSAPNELGKWTVYIRQHDENRIATGVETLIMKLRFGKKDSLLSYTRSEQMVLDYLKTHPTISLKDVTRIARLSQTEAERMLAHLVVYEVLHMENIEREPIFSIIDKNEPKG